MKVSSLQRLYISGKIVQGEVVELEQKDVHYITTVLRYKNNHQLRVFNESCGEYLAKVKNLEKKSCSLEIIEAIRGLENLPNLCLAQSLIKGDRMMQALSMATQLGVTDIVPIIAMRSQIKSINHERSMRVLTEAAEQSERLSIPILHEVRSLENFILSCNYDIIIYANENELDYYNIVNIGSLPQRVAVLIGPEGGFSDEELRLLQACSLAYSASLGPTVLRSETAAAALIAQVNLVRR